MEWLERMNRAIDYIEANLTEEIQLRETAHMACCSSYQFQRMFSFITDVTLSEYIRRRRLTLAALDLQRDDLAKVIDVALKYGYESPISFARAFHALHGITPTMARHEGIALKAYPRLSFLITVKGAEAMNYRIETKDSFEVFGIEGVFRVDEGGEVSQTPAKLWEQSHANGEVKRLEANAGDLPSFVSRDLHSVNAVCSYRKTGPNTFPYMLCAFEDEGSNTDGYTSVTIPAHTWAIFRRTRILGISSARLSNHFTKAFIPNGFQRLAMSKWRRYNSKCMALKTDSTILNSGSRLEKCDRCTRGELKTPLEPTLKGWL
jgi:AraC family transcriptional regulator